VRSAACRAAINMRACSISISSISIISISSSGGFRSDMVLGTQHKHS
jgi:hypothetical protein